jgi:hypothetical protein
MCACTGAASASGSRPGTRSDGSGEAVLEALEAAGTPARVAFDDPDAIVAVETVDRRASVSLWTREEMCRYPFLRLDRARRAGEGG